MMVKILIGTQLEGTIGLSFGLIGKKLLESFSVKVRYFSQIDVLADYWDDVLFFLYHTQQTLNYLVKQTLEFHWICYTRVDGNGRMNYLQWKHSPAAQNGFRFWRNEWSQRYYLMIFALFNYKVYSGDLKKLFSGFSHNPVERGKLALIMLYEVTSLPCWNCSNFARMQVLSCKLRSFGSWLYVSRK